MNIKQKDELHFALDRIERSIQSTREAVAKTIAVAKKIDDPDFKRAFIGELENYLDASMHAFIEDSNQSGSIASLREQLED